MMFSVLVLIALSILLWVIFFKILRRYSHSVIVPIYGGILASFIVVSTVGDNLFESNEFPVNSLTEFESMDLNAMEAPAAGFAPDMESSKTFQNRGIYDCDEPGSVECVLAKNYEDIVQVCQNTIESETQGVHEWIGNGAAQFTQSYWVLPDQVLSVDGDNLKLLDESGDMQKNIFRCWYDVERKKVVRVVFRPSLIQG